MEKLTIPLYIPKKNNELDYEGLMNIINDIDDCNILIGDYNFNKLSDLDYIKTYLFLNIIDQKNKYYLEKNYQDAILEMYKKNNNDYIDILGNIIPYELKEYLYIINHKSEDFILKKYINIFIQMNIDNEKKVIE